VPITAGGGTEDRVLWLASSGLVWFTRPAVHISFEALSGTLTVRFSIWQLAALLVRQAKAIGILSGTGLVAPAF
jgi:hypothetical protein